MKKEKWVLEKVFTFDAAHQLEHMPEGHKCGQLHGHTWKVIVRIACYRLHEPQDWVMDFGKLKEKVGNILSEYDHTNLNDSFSGNTTCENIAKALFIELDQKMMPSKVTFLESITVYETEGNGCTYRMEETL